MMIIVIVILRAAHVIKSGQVDNQVDDNIAGTEDKNVKKSGKKSCFFRTFYVLRSFLMALRLEKCS